MPFFIGGPPGIVKKWDGTILTDTGPFPSPENTYRCTGLFVLDENHVWAMMSQSLIGGVVNCCFWDGENWTKRSTAVPASGSIVRVWALSESEVYFACGTSAGGFIWWGSPPSMHSVLRSTDGGFTWSDISMSSGLSEFDNIGGTCYFTKTSGSVLLPKLQSYDGSLLDSDSSLPNLFTYGLVIDSDNIFYAHQIGDSSTYQSIVRGTWGGPWVEDLHIGPSTHDVDPNYPMLCGSGKELWFHAYTRIGGYTRIWHRDTGGTWTLVYNPSVSLEGCTIASDPNKAVLLACNSLDGSSHPRFLYSSDGVNFSIYSDITLTPGAGNCWKAAAGYASAAPVVSTTTISEVFVVAKDVIMVIFSNPVIKNYNFSDVNSYVLSNLTDSTQPIMVDVLPTYQEVTDRSFFWIRQMLEGNQYRLTIISNKLYDRLGNSIPELTCKWVMHKTKVDSFMGNLARLWDTNVGQNIRALAEAVGISDEYIGGDINSQIVKPSTVLGGSGHWGSGHWGGSHWGG